VWQCLTQRLQKRLTDANDPSLQLLPPPFVQIVRRALGGQATVEEIAVLLRPATSAVASVPTEKPVQPPVVQRPNPKPLVAEEEAGGPATELLTGRKSAPWILTAFVLLLIIAGFAMWAILHTSKRSPAASEQAASAKREVVIAPAAAPANPPLIKKPAPAMPAASQVASTPPAMGPHTVWRVVAYTYNRQDQAEHKVQMISNKYPDLQAEVFSPRGGAPYLVTVGGAMDREAAFRLREKAIREGLPRDTFAQNYSH
jgi:hypothetical protein